MDDQRAGAAFRSVRVRRRLRQQDVSARAGLSRSTVSRIERGHFDQLSLDKVRAVGRVLEIRVEIVARWRAGDLDRLFNARHSALHESVARTFRALRGWVAAPEVSFAVYGERGVIDILGWHSGRRALLVIELKTDVVDLQDLVGSIDRKRRLAKGIGRERGWEATTVSCWVIVADSKRNRARVGAHQAMLRAAFPVDGRTIRRWLRDPAGSVAALSFWPSARPGTGMADLPSQVRVRRRRDRPN